MLDTLVITKIASLLATRPHASAGRYIAIIGFLSCLSSPWTVLADNLGGLIETNTMGNDSICSIVPGTRVHVADQKTKDIALQLYADSVKRKFAVTANAVLPNGLRTSNGGHVGYYVNIWLGILPDGTTCGYKLVEIQPRSKEVAEFIDMAVQQSIPFPRMPKCDDIFYVQVEWAYGETRDEASRRYHCYETSSALTRARCDDRAPPEYGYSDAEKHRMEFYMDHNTLPGSPGPHPDLP